MKPDDEIKVISRGGEGKIRRWGDRVILRFQIAECGLRNSDS
jgi:hypothetical protein